MKRKQRILFENKHKKKYINQNYISYQNDINEKMNSIFTS